MEAASARRGAGVPAGPKSPAKEKGALAGRSVCSLGAAMAVFGGLLIIAGIVGYVLRSTHGLKLTNAAGGALGTGIVLSMIGLSVHYNPFSKMLAALDEELASATPRAEKITFAQPVPLEISTKDFFESKGIVGLPRELFIALAPWRQYRVDPVGFSARNPGYTFNAGVLLHGPTGTGKTTVAQAIAELLGGNFQEMACGALRHRLHGETEKKITKLFTVPEGEFCIAVVNEIDSLVPDRRKDLFGRATTDITNHFLGVVSGATEQKPRFILIGTTNRMDEIDDAALRGGRLGSQVELLPLGEEARAALFARHLRVLQLQLPGEQNLESFAQELASKMPSRNASGAEVLACVRNAQEVAMYEARALQKKDFFVDVDMRYVRVNANQQFRQAEDLR